MARRRFHKPQQKTNEPRINHRIKAATLRVVIEGEGQYVLSKEEAISKAKAMGMDLVEISPDQDPPVCKIIDYGKYKYEQQKKKKEQSRNQHTIQTKEVKMRPKIGSNDYDLKKRNGLKFLENGDKLKVTLRFRGREITHPQLGMQLLEKYAVDLEEVGIVETRPKMEGRQLVMMMSPKVSKKDIVKKQIKPKKAIEARADSKKVTVPEETADSKGN